MTAHSSNPLFSYVQVLQRDLREQRLDQAQFRFLLGVFLQREFNQFLTHKLNASWDQRTPATNKQFLQFSYRRNRHLNHA